MSRNLRFLLVLVLIGGAFAYRHFRDQPSDAHASAGTRHAPAAPAPRRMLGSLAFTPCTLAPESGAAGVEAQCATLPVAENPALPQGRRIGLHIAWVPSDEDGTTAPDPVFMLAGGPGQAATATFPQVAPAFREVLKSRNVILVDQRGTGDSNPLQCEDPEKDAADDAGGNTPVDAAPVDAAPADAGPADAATADRAARALRAAERCRDTLSKKADLRFYTTTDAVRDLETVRKAIGAASIDLVGISYGTRVAQQYAMRHPATTRTIVLDSVAPNTLILGNDFARNLEQALDLQFGQCGQVPACAKALGDPRSRLDALMARLRRDPPLVRYRDASTNQQREERLRPEHVAGLMRMYAYQPLASALLPLQLKEASEGRYEGLMAMAKMLDSTMTGQMTFGMQLSVICSEDAYGFKDNPDDAATLLGNQFADNLGALCQVWPRGTMPADFHSALHTRVPALLMSGEFDPVTPPRYGEAVARALPNARHLIVRGQGHNVIGSGCMPKLLAQFIDTADARGLDAKCLQAVPYTPPFTSFNGWEP